jgi:hypothetical protein
MDYILLELPEAAQMFDWWLSNPLSRFHWLLQYNLNQTGWWLTYPSEKYEFVSWDDYSQYMEK